MVNHRTANSVLRALMIVSTCFASGLAIKCFQCNTAVHSDCWHLKVNDTNSRHYKDCNEEYKYEGLAPFCRKMATEIISETDSSRIIRSCGWLLEENSTRIDHCHKADNDFIIKRHCECFNDACNKSDKIDSMFALALVVVPVVTCLNALQL